MYLINNAGMHTGGPVETSPIENIRLQMDTNFLGWSISHGKFFQ